MQTLELAGLRERVTEATPASWAAATLGLLGVCTAIALSTTQVAMIVGFLGGTLSSTIIFLIPILAYARLELDSGSFEFEVPSGVSSGMVVRVDFTECTRDLGALQPQQLSPKYIIRHFLVLEPVLF